MSLECCAHHLSHVNEDLIIVLHAYHLGVRSDRQAAASTVEDKTAWQAAGSGSMQQPEHLRCGLQQSGDERKAQASLS